MRQLTGQPRTYIAVYIDELPDSAYVAEVWQELVADLHERLPRTLQEGRLKAEAKSEQSPVFLLALEFCGAGTCRGIDCIL